jgi:hypothetical protein
MITWHNPEVLSWKEKNLKKSIYGLEQDSRKYNLELKDQ